ncbi:hypothetical protein CDG77_33860, partial [Nostoc sp. 'Peltigera membranacea cyanobiont' 213]
AAGILLQYTFWQFLTPISSSFVRNPGILAFVMNRGKSHSLPKLALDFYWTILLEIFQPNKLFRVASVC